MAVQNLGCTWKRNVLDGRGPYKFPVSFPSGATAFKSGEIIDLSGATAISLAADKAMAGIIAVTCSERRSGDLAGYQDVIVPRPGDIFEYQLVGPASDNPAPGTALYYSTDSQSVTDTAGNNILGTVVDASIIPRQGFQSVNPSYDATTTLRKTSKVLMSFKQAASYFVKLFP